MFAHAQEGINNEDEIAEANARDEEADKAQE